MTTTTITRDLLDSLTAQLGPDELAVLVLVAQGVARGRAVYGELRVDHDRREFTGEASAELRDALVYVAAELLRLERLRIARLDPRFPEKMAFSQTDQPSSRNPLPRPWVYPGAQSAAKTGVPAKRSNRRALRTVARRNPRVRDGGLK